MKAFHGLLWDSGFWELLDEIYQSDMFKISEMGDEECAQHKKTGSGPGMIAVKRVEHDTLHQGMGFISCLLSIFFALDRSWAGFLLPALCFLFSRLVEMSGSGLVDEVPGFNDDAS